MAEAKMLRKEQQTFIRSGGKWPPERAARLTELDDVLGTFDGWKKKEKDIQAALARGMSWQDMHEAGII